MITGKPHQVAIKSIFALFGIYPARTKAYDLLIADRAKMQLLTTWLNLLKRIPDEQVAYLALATDEDLVTPSFLNGI